MHKQSEDAITIRHTGCENLHARQAAAACWISNIAIKLLRKPSPTA